MIINLRKVKLTLFLATLITALFSIISYSNAFAATIGQALTAPESGWQRYQQDNVNIQYLGTGWMIANPDCDASGGTNAYTLSPNVGIKFSFTGTKIRIIDTRYVTYGNVTVKLDGVVDNTFSQNGTLLEQRLTYEKDGLTNDVHSIELTSNSTLTLDAIDIDENGELKPYNPNIISVSSLNLNKATTSLQVDGTETLIPTIAPADATNKNINWTSSDTSIATVDSTGKVTAIATGTAIITATTTDGTNLSATCTVNVTPKVNTRAILTITMANGVDKEYDLSSTEVDNFISWYDNKAAGTGASYYTFTKTINVAPFIKIKQYVIFDKIVSFDVSEYNAL